MKKEIMKISVILSLLLCCNFVSSNPQHKKSNDKSIGELNHVNDGGDDPNLARKESSGKASSETDWGGNDLNFLDFLNQLQNQKDQEDLGKNIKANNIPFLDALISQGSKFIESLTENPLLGNLFKWVQENVEKFSKLFKNEDHEHADIISKIKHMFINEEIEEHGDRAKRDLGTSGLPWIKSHKGSISEHVLKLSEGSTSNVLRSEKATVAEALNGRAAIRRILAQAKAKAAKVAQYEKLYDNDDFSNWLLSGSSFDTDIFRHPFHRPSHDAKITRVSESENIDDLRHHKFSVSHRKSTEPLNHHHHHEIKHTFNTLSDSAAVGTADTEDAYTKLLHKSEHQKHLSPELQIISGEEHSQGTNGMFHKPTASHNTHRSLSHEGAENTGLRHESSHVHAPHMHFRVREDEETGNGIPKWKHTKWTHTDPSTHHSAKSLEFETSDGNEKYEKKFIFETLFEPEFKREEAGDERVYTKNRKGHKISAEMNIYDKINHDSPYDEKTYGRWNLGHKQYYYGIGNRERPFYSEADTDTFANVENQHSAGSIIEHSPSVHPHREKGKNIRNKNKQYSLDGVHHSAIYSATSSETEEGIEKKQSGNMLITKISTDTPTRKPVNSDIEHYRTRDQSVAANSATSFSSSLSDEKGSKHTNNVFASPSADDGLAAVKTKTENDYGVLGRTHSVIDNDATSVENEMGFSGIKSHSPADLPLIHSSLSRVDPETHLGNQEIYRNINDYQRSTANTVASSETKNSMDAKILMANQKKNYDLQESQEVNANAASSAKAMTSVEHQRDLFKISSLDDDSREEDYIKARKKHVGLKGNYHTIAQHKTSIEVIDIPDRKVEVEIPEIPVYKFNRKGHRLHGVNYLDSNDQEMRDDERIEEDESGEDIRKNKINYAGLEEEENFAADVEMSEESKMISSNEHKSHDRYIKHRKNGKHDQSNYRHNKHNHPKDHSQHNHHTFNQHERDMTSSAIMSDTTKFETQNKYLIEGQKQEDNELSALESSSTVDKSEKQNGQSTKQSAETIESTDSNLQRVSSNSMSTSDNANKIVAREQTSNEKMSSSSATNGYRDYDLHKTSASSKSSVKSQMETDRSYEKSETNRKISAIADALAETASSSNAMDKSQTNVKNAIASSKSSAELQIGSQHNWSNHESKKKYKTNAESLAVAAISIGIKDIQEPISENMSLPSKPFIKSDAEILNCSNDLKNTGLSAVNSGSLSETAARSSVESETKTEQKSNDSRNVQINAYAETSSTAMSDNEKNERSFSSSERNAISKSSAKAMSNTVKDENSAEFKQNSNNLQDSQTSVSTAESLIKSSAFSNSENEHWSDSSKSSSSKSLEEMHMENKYSDDRVDKNIDKTSKTKIASSSVVESNQQESTSWSSLSNALSESISDSIVNDMGQHKLLLASSSEIADKSDSNDLKDKNPRKDNLRTADNMLISSTSTDDNNDKIDHRHHDDILKVKWLDPANKDNIEKCANNESIEKDEVTEQDSKSALNTAETIKAITGIKNMQNSMSASSSIDSKAETWTGNEHDLNQLKEERIITDDSIDSTLESSNKIESIYNNELERTSSLSDSHSISEQSKEDPINTIQNNQESQESMAIVIAPKSTILTGNERLQNDLVKEATLSEFSKEAEEKQNNLNISEEKSEDKVTIQTTSNSVNNLYEDDLLKDTSDISYKKMLMNNKLKDRNEVNTDNSGIENEVNSRVRIKELKGANNVNKRISMDFANLNNFNSEDRNNILKVASSDNLYAETSQKDEYESDTLSDTKRMLNTEVQNEELTSSADTKTQLQSDHSSNILSKEEAVNSTYNNLNERHNEFQKESSSHAESQIERAIAMKIEASAESQKSLFDSSNIAQAVKGHNRGDQDANDEDIARTSTKLKQHDLNVQEEDKAITSNMQLSIEQTNSSEMRNAHQELSEASSNSRTKLQHEQTNDITEENLEITANAATTVLVATATTATTLLSVETKSSREVESESQEKLIRDSSKSDSYAKSQVENNDSNVSEEEKIIPSVQTSANSAVSNNVENVQQSKPMEENLLSDPSYDTHKEDKNKNVPINNLADVADATASSRGTSSSIIKDEYQKDNNKKATTTASLSNSYAKAWTEHEYNTNFQRESIETTSSSDIEDRIIKSKNTVNVEENLKAAANTAVSADTISNSAKDISKQDSSGILLLSNANIEAHQGKSKNNLMKEIFITKPGVPKMTKSGNDDVNVLKKDLCNDENTAEQAKSFNSIENERQDNLMKAVLLADSFIDRQSMQKNESNVLEKQYLISTDSMTTSDSKISGYMNGIHKNGLEKLTATSLSNSHAKSDIENENQVNVLQKNHMDDLSANTSAQTMISNEFKSMEGDKSLQVTSSSDSYAEAQMKDEAVNNSKEDLDPVTNAKAEATSSVDIKGTNSHSLLDLLTNTAAKKETENKSISQKDVIKKDISKTSDFSSEEQVESAYDTKTRENNCEDSAIIHKMSKTENSNQQVQQDLREIEFLSSSTENSQRDVKATSSTNSYEAEQATREDVVKSEKIKENEEVTVNLSTSGKAEAYNKVKGAHSNGWLVTSSGATLAEKRTQNKDEFNVLRETEEAICAETSAEVAVSNNIKDGQHDIHIGDPSGSQNSLKDSKNIQDAISDSSEITALKGTKIKDESKSELENKITKSLSNDVYGETQTKDKEKYDFSRSLESTAASEEKQRSMTSEMSSESVSTSNNMKTDISTEYDKIIDEKSTKNIEGKGHLSSFETSLHLNKMSSCDENVETREFISEATSLYKMLYKQQDSEILLMKKNLEGPVQIANLKNSVPPLIAYRLIPREVYEKIRTIIANKQISCVDCPLSNNQNK